jgi:hypothetical protein
LNDGRPGRERGAGGRPVIVTGLSFCDDKSMTILSMESLTMLENRRGVLADYLDKRVVITGVFEKITVNKNPSKPFKVALLQDVEVELSKGKHDLGHVWVQHAETFAGLNYGDRVQCSCRVGQYRRSLAVSGENGTAEKIDYSLTWPNDIKVLNHRPVAYSAVHEEAPAAHPAPAAPPPAPEAPAKATDPVQLILQIKELAQKVGGVEHIVELKAVMDKIGGWERVLEVEGMVEGLGGWGRFEQLLALLKL